MRQMKRNFIVFFITILFALTHLLIPNIAFANSITNENYGMYEETILESPWQENDTVYFLEEASYEFNHNDHETLYGDEAIELFERLKKENEEAKRYQSIIEQQNEKYQNGVDDSTNLQNSTLIDLQSTKSQYRTKFQALAILGHC